MSRCAIPDVAFGIDQGKSSGWGLMRVGTGRFIDTGLARTARHRRRALELALAACEGDVSRLLVMLEDHTKMPITRLTRADFKTRRRAGSRRGAPQRSTGSIIGQGDSRGRWLERLDDLDHPRILRDKVEPRVWRIRVLGTTGGGEERLKRLACQWASTRVGLPIRDHNQAEGVAITAFCALDGLARLEQRRRKARERAQLGRLVQQSLELGDDEDSDDDEEG